MADTSLRSAQRQIFGLQIYRGLLNLCLLVSAYRTFPEHSVLLSLAVLVFSQGLAAIGQMNVLENVITDRAERKTRHAIFLAAEPDWHFLPDFWVEVDRRVSAEIATDEKPLAWWATLGLVVWNVFSRLIGDLITIAFAVFIAGL